jgi:SanA protein
MAMSATGLLAFGATNLHVLSATVGHRYEVASAPAEALVVLGARIHPDGRPFHMLVDRLDAALQLWRQGAAPRILLSGRGGGELHRDEVAAMRRWLLARGVPGDALVDDCFGLRTIDSMRRCRDVFGFRRVVVVTNEFHLARSVFLARHAGLDALGFGATALVDYGVRTTVRNQGRELLARSAAWFEVLWEGGR